MYARAFDMSEPVLFAGQTRQMVDELSNFDNCIKASSVISKISAPYLASTSGYYTSIGKPLLK